MKEFGLEKIIFVCTDSTEIFFSKLRSAGLNYNLPCFFTDSYCAGVSNKHCLLTFFIIFVLIHVISDVIQKVQQRHHDLIMVTCHEIGNVYKVMLKQLS